MILVLKHCDLGHNRLDIPTGLFVSHLQGRNGAVIAIRTTGARLLWAALVIIHGKGGVFLLIPAQVFRVGDLLVRCNDL